MVLDQFTHAARTLVISPAQNESGSRIAIFEGIADSLHLSKNSRWREKGAEGRRRRIPSIYRRVYTVME